MSKYPGRIVTDLAPAGYSVYFDGTGDFLTLPNVTALTLGTGDFTLEGWFYAPNLPGAGAYRQIVDLRAGNFNNAGLNVDLFGSTLEFTIGANVAGTATVVANQWYHFALVRSGTTYSSYLNGSRVATGSNSTNLTGFEGYIGSYNSSGTNVFFGYISNVRILKGTALYSGATINVPTQLLNITNTSLLTCNSPAIIDQSSNPITITVNGNSAVSTFTPFTAYVPYNPALGASTPGVWTLDEALQAAGTRQWNMYDPYFNSTTLLLHGNPTNGTTWLTDASTNRFTVTPNGDARAAGLTPFSQTTFATAGSGYLDGTGDWLSIANNAAFDLGTGDCTVECWLYRATSGTLQGIVTAFPSGGTPINGWGLFINTSNFVYMDSWVGNVEQTFTATNNAISTNTWTHIAYTRESGTSRLFVNGQLCTATGPLTQAINTGGFELQIGRSNYGATNYVTGYISNVRIVKGTAVYTSTFTTPTAPLTAIANTSLLTLQNSQSANNNAFLDSSSNNFLITRNGNTTQGSFSPFSQTGWSVYFNADTITTPSSSAFDPSGQNVTVDFFIYLTRYPQANNVVFEVGVSTVGDLQCNILNTGDVRFATGGNVGSSISGFTLNTWHYVTCVKSGNNLTVYLNLVAGPTVSLTANSRTTMYIGSQSGGNNIEGYISNFRYVRGSANVPTAIPTSPLTAITNTSLLTFQNNRFVDNSSNGFTLNSLNDASVQAFSPFYPTAAYTPQTIGGSGYFDGTGDYLVLPASSAFDTGAGTSDVTFECWVYNNGFSGSQYGRGIFVFYKSTDYNNNRLMVRLDSGSNAINCFLIVNGAVQFGVSGTNSTRLATPFAWTHVALVRSSQTFRLYINGVLDTTLAATTASLNGFDRFEVGRTQDGSVPDFNGNISGFRYLKGTAQYTSAFTPPTTPPTAITNTQLLLNFTNAGVVDSTGKNALETVGDARISTALSVFGGSSMSFNGTNSTLLLRNSQLMNLGSSDFTLEFWMYRSAAAASQPFYSLSGGSQTNVLALDMNASGNLLAYATASGGGTWGLLGGVSFGTVPLTTWTHVALVRNGSTWRGYLNGVVGFTVTNSSAIASFDGVSIGSSGASTLWFNGFIDDFRITRFARYTGNFTPQTSQWQDQ